MSRVVSAVASASLLVLLSHAVAEAAVIPPVVTPTVDVKLIKLSWPAVAGATSYQAYEDRDGLGVFVPWGPSIPAGAGGGRVYLKKIVSVHKRKWDAQQFYVEAGNAAGCASSAVVNTYGSVLDALGYVKASNTESGDRFGYSVAVSADGMTVAIGAYTEDSGLLADPADNSALGAGAVYVYVRHNGTWSQEGYIKASNIGAGDSFGYCVALSDDGDTLAVGAFAEDSNATGVNGNGANNLASDSGAAYVFTRTAGAWTQQAYVKASTSFSSMQFGAAVALDGAGDTLAVGAPRQSGSEGAAYVFTRVGGVWSEQRFLKASNPDALDAFGWRVALSDDGNTLAVAAPGEASGIALDPNDNSAALAGAVYAFTRSAGTWPQEGYLKAAVPDGGDQFGTAISLSADGNVLAIGAIGEDGSGTGSGANQADNSAGDSGAAYVFTRNGLSWTQESYVKASNTEPDDQFGASVAISADGSKLAVGASAALAIKGEDSAATGINGSQTDNTAANSGAVYLLTRNGATVTHKTYVKASNTGANDLFGWALALDSTGDTLVIGAPEEDGSDVGVSGGVHLDNAAAGAGAAYLY
jgi:hypothetical protein